MSDVLYPTDFRGLAFSVVKTAEFSTLVSRATSGMETRVANFLNPLWHWTLQYSVLFDRANQLSPGYSVTEYQFLQGFFLARQAQFDDFLFFDPKDNTVGPALLPGGVTPNPQAALQIVDDGAGNFYSPIQRNFGGLFYEDVTDLATAVGLYANGALKTPVTDYTIMGPGLAIPGFSSAGLYIKWVAPPASPVTAQFGFYFRVRFETDEQDFEQFSQDLWAIGGDGGQSGSGQLKLVTSRRLAA